MNHHKEKQQCTGCHACLSACPQHSITMPADNEGFWYPLIDRESCRHCGLCAQVCPVVAQSAASRHMPQAYAAYNKNTQVRLSSSSGGVFTLLAEQVLQAGGVVFGAAFDADFNVVHTAAENTKALTALRSSKYVQSQIGDAFRQAAVWLKQGRQVLFTGNPCQVAGLLSYVGKPYPNLITQDMICHGVPSPKVWRKYLTYRMRQEGQGAFVQQISFRSKTKGWQQYALQIIFANGQKYEVLKRNDTYMRAFLSDICLRPSCYTCRFKTVARASDITLADYWGIQAQHPEMDDQQGVSLVLVHSGKGARLFAALKEQMCYKRVDVAEALRFNQSAVTAAARNAKRPEFFAELDSCEFDKLINTYCREQAGLNAWLRRAAAKLRLAVFAE